MKIREKSAYQFDRWTYVMDKMKKKSKRRKCLCFESYMQTVTRQMCYSQAFLQALANGFTIQLDR